ncbi:peptidoglycan-binding domain 1 protein [Clostridium sp. CAG:492]|nr:peptidoglycan-binding domain 1 protein [Clostridium sp. CAG:492]
MRKRILIILASILAIITTLCNIYIPNHKINNTIQETQNIIQEEIKNDNVTVSEYVYGESSDVKEATITNKEDISTKQLPEATETDEKNVEEEITTEIDAQIEQENISYNGASIGNGLALLGAYQGLTYYSQADSRWASVMYSSINDSTQTMKASACGPTSAAMVISSSKGSILPTTLASLAVSNGYRTKNSGTAWSFYPFIADYFGFYEYYTTDKLETALNYLSQKNSDGTSKYYIICSCGSGLFTYNGHYIVLTSLDGDTMQVYDPYLYNNKFATATRKKANVTISGNSVFVNKENFRKYANYKNFWIFSNDKGSGNTNSTTINNVTNYTKYVATKSSSLNVRKSASINSSRIYSLTKGTKVNVIEVSGNWSKISSPVTGWVNTTYLSSTQVYSIVNDYKIGTYKVTSNLHVRSGPGTNYKIKIYNQLTTNAKAQNKRLGNQYYNGYLKGVTCTVTQVKSNWGKTTSGWICLDYCKKIKK